MKYLSVFIFDINSNDLEMPNYLMLNVSVHSLQHAFTSVLIRYKGHHLCKRDKCKKSQTESYSICNNNTVHACHYYEA